MLNNKILFSPKVLQKSPLMQSSHSNNKPPLSSTKGFSSLAKNSGYFEKSSLSKTVQSSVPLKKAHNSLTVEVSTSLDPSQKCHPVVQNRVTLSSNAVNTTTISQSSGTEIHLHQNDFPIYSVITFEKNAINQPEVEVTNKGDVDGDKFNIANNKIERPLSLCNDVKEGLTGQLAISELNKENKPKQLTTDEITTNTLKSTNHLNNSQAHLVGSSSEKLKEKNISFRDYEARKNTRNHGLTLSKDALMNKHFFRALSKKNVSSTPSSPTKSYDSEFGGSFKNVFIENLENIGHLSQGLKSGLDKTRSKSDHFAYPSLSDIQVHLPKVTAQKVLNDRTIDSIDKLADVNVTAIE